MEIRKAASFSECQRYRYTLSRIWDARPSLVVIGHNPSTADAEKDDPTIRRCIGFAQRDGFGGLIMLNLCAWRDTDPKGLTLLEDPVGPDNDGVLLAACEGAGRVVAAWGALSAQSKSQKVRNRPMAVLRLLAPHVDVWAFRLTRGSGQPEHPLYLPKDVTPLVYRRRTGGGN